MSCPKQHKDLTTEQLQHIWRLRDQGKTPKQIAPQVGARYERVRQVIKSCTGARL